MLILVVHALSFQVGAVRSLASPYGQSPKSKFNSRVHSSQSGTAFFGNSVLRVKGGSSVSLLEAFKVEMGSSVHHLFESFQSKSEGLLLLGLNSVVTPLFAKLRLSPIVGFLLSGILLGPNGLNVIKNLHLVDVLGELGIVLFLFEMGLELSLEKLISMKKDVFGLGSAQFLLTSLVFGGIAALLGFSTPAAITIGGGLALSSSAFVLQLLKDKEAMESRYAKASFGILLLQDLAVVPLLVIIQLLSQGGEISLITALSFAAIKAVLAVAAISVLGVVILPRFFSLIQASRSHEALLSAISTLAISMSYFTHGIGLSDSLGAFATGIALSPSHHRHSIEKAIAPVRGLLLSLFFVKVGFGIDPAFLLKEAKMIAGLLFGLIAIKASIISFLSVGSGLSLADALRTGLLNSQGGEFAFVALGMAETAGLLTSHASRLISTVVALSMAITPLLAEIGDGLAKKVEKLKHH